VLRKSPISLTPQSVLNKGAVARFVADPPADGPWNLAMDEALLEYAQATENIILRLYAWQQPTVSLGYFQKWKERERHPDSMNCPAVRRPSGGGAIVHDRELTYALAVPNRHRLAGDPCGLYLSVHEALANALRAQGVPAVVRGELARAPVRQDAFLCFQRAFRGDVLVNRAKIAGSAQRRRAGAILQHGSLLLARSPSAPQLPGILELTAIQVVPEQLQTDLTMSLARTMGIQFEAVKLEPAILSRARQLVRKRYACNAWLERR
jgi:lipoate-protein ligase A